MRHLHSYLLHYSDIIANFIIAISYWFERVPTFDACAIQARMQDMKPENMKNEHRGNVKLPRVGIAQNMDTAK